MKSFALGTVILLLLTSISGCTTQKPSQGPPGEPPGGEVVLNDRLRQPENNDNLQQVIVNNDSIVYKYKSDPGSLNYSTGDYLAGTTGAGYLRRVTGVHKSGTEVTVSTANAALSEVVRKGQFNLTRSFSPDQIRNTTKGGRGAPIFEFNQPLSWKLLDSEDVTVEIFGNAKITWELVFNTSFRDGRLDSLYLALRTTENVTVGLRASASVTLSKNVTIYTHTLTPIVFFLGFLPVVIVPILKVVVGVDIELEASVVTSIECTMTTVSGARFSGGKWTPVSEETRALDYDPPQLEQLEADVTAYALFPRIELMLYGLIGPFFELMPYLRLHATTPEPEEPWWTLYCGIKGNVGINVGVFDEFLSNISLELFNLEWEIANSLTASGKKSAPSAPMYLAASPGAQQVILTWKPPFRSGGCPVTNYTVYRGTTPGGMKAVADVGNVLAYTDGGLAAGKTCYYRVSALNPEGEGPMSEEVTATPTLTPPYGTLSTLWTRNWGGSRDCGALGIGIDSSAVYVSGVVNASGTDYDVALLKYNQDGNLAWNRTWGGAEDDYGTRVAVMSSEIFVAGYSISTDSTSIRAFLLKYDSGGNLVWNRTWSGSSKNYCCAAAVDASGIYIAGYTSDFLMSGTFLVKYGLDGSLLWNTTWGSWFSMNFIFGMALDSSSVFMVGYTFDIWTSDVNLLVLKYGKDGGFEWSATWGGPNIDFGYAVAVQQSAIYVTGHTDRYGTSDFDACVLRYDQNGKLLWNITWGGPTTLEIAAGLAVDLSGIYVAGQVNDTLAGTSDAYVFKFDLDGNVQWSRKWGGPANDSASCVAVDSSSLYLAGSITDTQAGMFYIFVLKGPRDQ